MRVVTKKAGSTAVLHFTANGTANLVGNSTTSDIAVDNEVISKSSIRKVWAGCEDGAHWVVSRGSNVVAVFGTTLYMDFAGGGTALTLDPTDDLTVTLNNGANGFIMIEVSKESNLSGTQWG